MKVTRVVLASRPGPDQAPKESNFRSENAELPVESDKTLIRSLLVSVDPALRCRMNEVTGVDYLSPWKIDETIEGLGGIGIIEYSPDGSNFNVGDIVTSKSLKWPWQTHFHADAQDLDSVPDDLKDSLPTVFSCVGLIGLTVLIGIRQKGGLKECPKHDGIPLTFVVSGAAGACGLLAGQIARLEGAERIIGICGSDEKCDLIKREFGYDIAINYKTCKNISEVLPSNEIHAYFDNVGGEISEAVIENMAPESKVILCGQISQYNKDVPYPPPISSRMAQTLKDKSIQRDRFLVLNYADQFQESLEQLATWVKEGKLKTRETIIDGIENAGLAFVQMMNGRNIGKQLVRVASK